MVKVDHPGTSAEWHIRAMRRACGRSYVRRMTTTETFQIPPEVAEIYESKFVPGIFAEWAPHILDVADVGAGDDVLDVACGTGIVARTARERVGHTGTVTGVDLNEAMLAVARRVAPEIDWRQGDVGALPFDDDSFDAVLCQMAFMFFADPTLALSQMARVARQDATVAVVVPASLADQPAYGPLVDVAARHAGPEAMSLLGTYWAAGDLDELTRHFEAAGLDVVTTRTRTGTARFGSADELVTTEVEGSPLRERLDDDTYALIRQEAGQALEQFMAGPGNLEAPLVCHIVAGQPRPA